MKHTGLSILLFSLILIANNKYVCFAQAPSVSQIERSQEILQQEEALRKKIDKEEKVFIKKIIIKGVTLITKDQIAKVIAPFQRHWLNKADIQQLLDLIEQAYILNGYTGQINKSSFKVEKGCLIIEIEEK